MEIKYSDQIAIWLKEIGYTHYFYVGGGNIMHLTESLSKHLIGIPVIHEVAAGIAAEYFNEISDKKALALVTAGPGLTNIITAISGSWLESRELLILGGQVKTSDLSSEYLRSRGIQEIKGVELVKSTTKLSKRFDNVIDSNKFYDLVSTSWEPRKGPVFLEFPIDIQARKCVQSPISKKKNKCLNKIANVDIKKIVELFNKSKRPILLIGGGVSYKLCNEIQKTLSTKKIPIMTTYNGVDRYSSEYSNYLGRPNTWGQRSSNIIIQKSDLIIALGTRLGLQQTGFNWQEFGRDAKVVHIDIDKHELNKGHPYTDFTFDVDADDFLKKFIEYELDVKNDWLNFAKKIRNAIPRVEKINNTGENFISPYNFIVDLEKVLNNKDIIIPCSSGSAFTLTMQLLANISGQRVLTNKSLASMGYGLSGAIGAAIASGDKRTILIEGDGGFAQNLQEIGTAVANNLNLKIFIFNDQGHASIRMTQRNYFDGKYLGCDINTGLGLPNWSKLFNVWDIKVYEVNKGFLNDPEFISRFNEKGIQAFVVQIDPEQTYFPKISSKVNSDGNMTSNPIDEMTPKYEIKF